MTVPWWSVNRDPGIHQGLAQFVNVVDLVGQMAKIPALVVLLRVPVVRQFDLRFVIAFCREKYEREPACFAFVAFQLA